MRGRQLSTPVEVQQSGHRRRPPRRRREHCHRTIYRILATASRHVRPLSAEYGQHGLPSWSQVSQPFGTQLTGIGIRLTATIAIRYSRARARAGDLLDGLLAGVVELTGALRMTDSRTGLGHHARQAHSTPTSASAVHRPVMDVARVRTS
ncbi:hypothetical protein ACFYY1_40910 [Streptomyces sp. NPDC001890]|uniref:hypothetical protein n=1 Tax=Streptomyces sp. NPDC001890 TaxID=3364620 RepID=UPI0036B0CDF8